MDDLLGIGYEHPELRDEIYLQVVKQLHDNPSIHSIEKTWNILNVCLQAWPPSNNLENYLEMFLRQHQKDEYIAALHTIVFVGPQFGNKITTKGAQKRRQSLLSTNILPAHKSAISTSRGY